MLFNKYGHTCFNVAAVLESEESYERFVGSLPKLERVVLGERRTVSSPEQLNISEQIDASRGCDRTQLRTQGKPAIFVPSKW